MGCGPSVHPSIYDQEHKGERKPKKKKTVEIIDANANRQIKGDHSQFQAAKYIRNMQRKDRQMKLFAAANEMSDRIMEEREMLSLGTRSRGTSRGTSRAGSPATNKKNSPMKVEEQVAPMTPVTENDIASRGSDRRDTGQPNGHAIIDEVAHANEADVDETVTKDAKSSKKKRKTKTKPKTTKPKKQKKHKKSRKVGDRHENDAGTDSDNEIENIDKTNYVQLALAQPHNTENTQDDELVDSNKDSGIENNNELNEVTVTQSGDSDKMVRDHQVVSQNSISVAPISPEIATDHRDNSNMDIT